MAETKKIGIYLDADAIALLAQLAPGYQKGRFVSQLIREAAARTRQPSSHSDLDQRLADLGRQVLRLVEATEVPLARATAVASEPALARIWATPEEDEAWQHL